ncbi:MAG TPA: hypothetical protein VHI72_15485 [Hyphomicrobiaceae bacterium]|nr:hypothetical protein [Hyphomicrobiaceae bacterium]
MSATSTSVMRPAACAPIRTSPPDGSTRPGAEAAQPDLAAVLGAAEPLPVDTLEGVDVEVDVLAVVVVLPVVVMGAFWTSA